MGEQDIVQCLTQRDTSVEGLVSLDILDQFSQNG